VYITTFLYSLCITPPLGNIPVNIFAIILPADAAGPRPEVFKCITEKQCLEKLTHLNARVYGNIASVIWFYDLGLGIRFYDLGLGFGFYDLGLGLWFYDLGLDLGF